MNESIIELKNVEKKYKMYNSSKDKLIEAFDPRKKKRHTDFSALTDISFGIRRGEIVGIIGRNGAGKSTLLKIISGILKPSNGSVAVRGRVSSLLELGTGFNMEYTGLENIYFYGTLMGLTRTEVDQRLKSIIEFAEIGDYIGQAVKTYSSGMFARLAFSCAINVDPEIIIVDEILSVGDMRFQSKCFKKFLEFKKKGVTILYVGHDVGMMRSFCDRCIWLNNGRIVAEGEPKYITSKYTEYMYDDRTETFTQYKRFETNDKIGEKQSDNSISNIINDESIQNDRFSNVLSHWGSNLGTIRSVDMYGQSGETSGYFQADEELTVEIQIEEPDDFKREYVSIDISIKDKQGTDIVVVSSYDKDYRLLNKKTHRLFFQFSPRLRPGDYSLTVAVENRENNNPVYVEYIEGVKYFKIFSEKTIFGIYDVQADIIEKEPY